MAGGEENNKYSVCTISWFMPCSNTWWTQPCSGDHGAPSGFLLEVVRGWEPCGRMETPFHFGNFFGVNSQVNWAPYA